MIQVFKVQTFRSVQFIVTGHNKGHFLLFGCHPFAKAFQRLRNSLWKAVRGAVEVNSKRLEEKNALFCSLYFTTFLYRKEKMTKLITIFFPTCRIFPVQKGLSFFVSWERIGKSSHIHQSLNNLKLVNCVVWSFDGLG